MSNLKNVEIMDQSVQQETHKKTWFQRFRTAAKYSVVPVAVAYTSAANAAMPDVDVADILTYIGLLVAAVATVGSAFLMVYLAAKGIKAIRAAF
jgi:hypothetical protein